MWIRRALDAEEKYVAGELATSNTDMNKTENKADTYYTPASAATADTDYKNTQTDDLRTYATWAAANTDAKITDYKAAATFTNAEKDLK